ncbi:MAG: response regulator [Bacteroidetes bacterium]|nr:response regulator [Bacteroidota bacterium]
MEMIMDNIEWIFGGIGVPVIVLILKKIFKNRNAQKGNPGIINTNNIVINNNAGGSTKFNTDSSHEDTNKSLVRILFVDDQHTDFKMVSILKRSGWINTKSVKDITDLDDPRVLEADIIFVDINGVASALFKDQGLGLASALKKKYQTKKIVLYSAETTGDRFHKALREVDSCLYKDAEPYQFISLIESLSPKAKS